MRFHLEVTKLEKIKNKQKIKSSRLINKAGKTRLKWYREVLVHNQIFWQPISNTSENVDGKFINKADKYSNVMTISNQ